MWGQVVWSDVAGRAGAIIDTGFAHAFALLVALQAGGTAGVEFDQSFAAFPFLVYMVRLAAGAFKPTH